MGLFYSFKVTIFALIAAVLCSSMAMAADGVPSRVVPDDSAEKRVQDLESMIVIIFQNPNSRNLGRIFEQLQTLRREVKPPDDSTAILYKEAMTWGLVFYFKDQPAQERFAKAQRWAYQVSNDITLNDFRDFKLSFSRLYNFARRPGDGRKGVDERSAFDWALKNSRLLTADQAKQFVDAELQSQRNYERRIREQVLASGRKVLAARTLERNRATELEHLSRLLARRARFHPLNLCNQQLVTVEAPVDLVND